MQASKILLSNVQVAISRRLLEVWEFFDGEVGVAYKNCNIKEGEWLHGVFGKGSTFEEACEDYLSKIRGETLVFDYNKPNRFEVDLL